MNFILLFVQIVNHQQGKLSPPILLDQTMNIFSAEEIFEAEQLRRDLINRISRGEDAFTIRSNINAFLQNKNEPMRLHYEPRI